MTARVLTDDVLRASLKLPKTTFSMKAQASVREVRMVQRLTVDLYRRQFQERKGEKEFVLHDGPPYANGDVHMGHLLNKTLKDIVNRWSLLQGDRIRYVPGWDCHGLPIELKALEALGAKHGSATAADPLAIRAAAKSFAEAARKRQAAEFKRWGVLGDWDGEEGEAYYITMLPSYEARQLGKCCITAAPHFKPSLSQCLQRYSRKWWSVVQSIAAASQCIGPLPRKPPWRKRSWSIP